MNELQNKSSDYIDCDTTKTKRKTIIEKFKSGELPFLVNVKILVEGFDAPITNSSLIRPIYIGGYIVEIHSIFWY